MNRWIAFLFYVTGPVITNWVYLNPFSARTVPRSAFHCIANPICVLGLKGLATVNNLLIAKGSTSGSFSVKGVQDQVDEANETIATSLLTARGVEVVVKGQ
ncbi:MAG: hypothetical protein EBV45_05695, partial [Chloroflexi bacterium]|nr:hypothetical protein [Chloroflexota bacterium]